MASEKSNPTELLLGIFFNSATDITQSLYVSFDGYTFRKISEAYLDKNENGKDTPDYIKLKRLRDPGLIYKGGVFWNLSGYDTYINNEKRFVPMWGYSKNLVDWSVRSSGSSENVSAKYNGEWPYSREGKKVNTSFDSVAPDPFLDDDGTVWVVVSLGFYGMWYRDTLGTSSWDDAMKPYLIKVPILQENSGNAPIVKKTINGKSGEYMSAIPINLPTNLFVDERENVRKCEDRIDGALYKENGKYFLVIKRFGTTNEIWSIDSLEKVSDSTAWRLVNSDFVTGFEAPCLTKYKGNYYIYTDKLADHIDNSTGIHVTCTNNLYGKWKKNVKVKLLDKSGNNCEGRHGTVVTITDVNAIKVIMKLYNYQYPPSGDKSTIVDMKNGWFRQNGKSYMYQNGTMFVNREWFEAATGEWYWFDSDGTMARNKDVFIPFTSDRSEGKWVYYDEFGHMVKGEHFHNTHWEYYDTNIKNGGWYYYDLDTGEKAVNKFVYIPKKGAEEEKWVYYGSDGRMQYGEQCIKGNWYRFDSITGKMIKGDYCDSKGNWYYYDLTTGIMAHGKIVINGVERYYDDITGVRKY